MTIKEFYNWCLNKGITDYKLICDRLDMYGYYDDTVDVDEECLHLHNDKRTMYIIDIPEIRRNHDGNQDIHDDEQ